jgi:prevent-host-death family protein
MKVSVSVAKGQLTELVRLAEAGEEVILTRHGAPVIRLQSVKPPIDVEQRRRAIDAIVERARAKLLPGPCAARAADFLYDDETGLPS